MNDIIENGHGQAQASQLDAGGGGVSAAAGSVSQSNDLLDQFSAPDLEHSNLNQVNLNLNDLNDSTINLNNSNGSLDLGSININFPLSGADSSIKTAPSPKKTSSKKRKLDELAFENISDSESAGSSSSKESKTKEIKYGAEFSFGGNEPAGNQDFLDAAASTILADAEPKSHDENEPAAAAPDPNNPNSNEQAYQQQQQQQQPLSNRQPTPNRVASPAYNHQLQSPYMMQQQNGAAQIQSPGCQQQQQQPVPSPMSQSHQAIQSPMQAKPPTPHANQHAAAAPSPAHYHRSQLDEANFQGVPPHHVQQQQQQQQPPPPPPQPQPTFIHVFTTQIANDAAQSVARQQTRSIIEFHRNMPATIDFMRTFHHHQSMRPNGVPLPVPNEHLTLEQLKTRTEKLGKLKNLSSIIGIGGQMEPGAKRARSSNPPGQVPGSGAPSPFTNGADCYPMDQFNPMMPNYEPYRMGSPQQQHQQQQGPPPPYALKPKMHKAAPPEKYTDKMKSGQSPCMPPNIDNVNTGLQTTPSPQLMNYFELEGQELTITKQLNHSFKSNGPDDDNKTLARPPSAQNSNIINCLNGSVSQSGNDESDKHKQQQQQQQQQQDLEQYAGNEAEQSRKTPGINKSLSNSQLDYYQGGVNSPHNSNNNNSNSQSSPAMNGASGPLNQMLQMTNSIPKASPYSNAKSPGPNHPQFGGPAHQPQMSSSPSPIMQQQGPPGQSHQGPPPPHMLMQQQQPQAMPPGIKNGKMSKKHQQQQQQQQQEMMQRGMMMDGMGPPPHHGMHRGPLPPPHMLPPHMINHPGMGDPRLMAPRFPNGPNFRPMRDPDMFQNGGGPPPPPPPHNPDYPPAEYAKPSHRSKSRQQQPQNDMPMPNGMMMNAPPPHPPNMMPMKYPPHEQQMYPPHHNEFANGPPRPMHPMHMGPRPPIDPAMLPPGIMPNGMPPGMMRPMHPNQQQQGPPPFDMPPPPPHHLHHYSQQQSQNAQQNFDNPNNSNSNNSNGNNNNNNYNSPDQQQQQNQVLPQMLQNSANQQSQQQHHQQQQQQQQSQQELNSLQQQMGLGPGPGGDNLAFPDLSDPILQFGD